MQGEWKFTRSQVFKTKDRHNFSKQNKQCHKAIQASSARAERIRHNPNMATKATKVPVVPKILKGTPDEDPEKYLIQFERAAICNNWNDNCKERYLPVYLEGTANTWFQNWSRNNNIATITWAGFKPIFTKAFLSTAKVEVAERKLNTRKQRIGESAEDYLYEMVDLCYAVDELMPEAKVVRHIIKGLRPTFLEKVNMHDPKTIAEALELIRKIHETRYLVNANEEDILSIQPTVDELAKTNELIEKLTSLMIQQNELINNTHQWSLRPNENLG